MKKRFALILGGPHAGTSRLFGWLGSHPQVLPCRVKEPRFFSDDRRWALGLDWYRSLWDFREPDERVAIEATAEYALHPLVPCPAARVAQSPAGFRFVFVLRDPVDRITAWQAAQFAEGLAESATAFEGLERELAACRYATQLAAWHEHFPREDFLLLDYEDWVAAPAELLARLCKFLEIDAGWNFPDPLAERSRRRGRGGVRGWLGRRSARRRPASAPHRLPHGLEQAVLHELVGDRERLAVEWGFDSQRWRGPEPA
jgi:hypothetical protein